MATNGVARHHHVFGNIFLIGNGSRDDPLAFLYNALGMRNPGAHFNDDRRVKFFGKFKRLFGKFTCLGGIRRLKHRNLGCDCMMAGILLVLGRMHARVVCHTDYHACVYPCIRTGKQRIRRNV